MDLDAEVLAFNRRRLGLDPTATAKDHHLTTSQQSDRRLLVYGSTGWHETDAELLNAQDGTREDVTFSGFLSSAPDGPEHTGDTVRTVAWTPTGPQNQATLFRSAAITHDWLGFDQYKPPEVVRLLAVAWFKNGTNAVANVYAARDATRTQLLMLDGLNVHADEAVL